MADFTKLVPGDQVLVDHRGQILERTVRDVQFWSRYYPDRKDRVYFKGLEVPNTWTDPGTLHRSKRDLLEARLLKAVKRWNAADRERNLAEQEWQKAEADLKQEEKNEKGG